MPDHIIEPLEFLSITGADGHVIFEWTAEAERLLKKSGKRVVFSLPHDGYGGFKPQLNHIDALDVPITVESTHVNPAPAEGD